MEENDNVGRLSIEFIERYSGETDFIRRSNERTGICSETADGTGAEGSSIVVTIPLEKIKKVGKKLGIRLGIKKD